MTAQKYVVCTIVALLAGHPLRAQGVSSPGGVIAGTAVEAATGKPVPRAAACVVQSGRNAFVRQLACAAVDSTSLFVIENVPPGKYPVSLACETLRGFGAGLGTDTVVVVANDTARVSWRVSLEQCDPRPLRHVAGEFTGYYTPGFESSEFVPCQESAWFVSGDSLRTGAPFDERRAWIEYASPSASAGVNWPKGVKVDAWGNPTYWVRVRGSVEGPGRYGHLGVSAFVLRVDRVLEVRAPGRGTCKRVE